MTDNLWQHISACIERTDDAFAVPRRICLAGMELLESDSMSIALVVDGEYEPLGSSDALGSVLDDLQFSLGDGPVFTVQGDSDPILVDDLFGHLSLREWPLFCDAVRAHQVRGVFAFPLRIGAANLGVMTAYRVEPGHLTAEQFSYGLVLASFAGAEIVRHLAGDPGRAVDVKDPITYDQTTVQFAAGMVAERLGIGIVDALVRIRAHAFSSGMTVTEVGRSIASGRIVLEL
jgi:GAF domain-containing protein